MINKQLAAAERVGDKAEIARLQEQLQGIGGLETYQRSSVKGHTQTSANTSKWLISTLQALNLAASRDNSPLLLLDVVRPCDDVLCGLLTNCWVELQKAKQSCGALLLYCYVIWVETFMCIQIFLHRF